MSFPELPPDMRRRPFTRQEAERAGVPRSAFIAGRLRKLFYGVYSARDLEPTDLVRSWAALLAVRGPGAIGGASALKLYGLQAPLDDPNRSDVLVVRDHVKSHRGPQGIRVHATRLSVEGRPWRTRPEVLVVDPVTAWLQTAELGASVYQLVVFADGLLRRNQALSTMAELRAAIDRAAHIDGITTLRQAIELVRPGTDSSMETHSRLLVVAAGLPEPEVNVQLIDPQTRKVRYLDLGFEPYHVGGEYDGDYHREALQWRKDRAREACISALGWELVHATADIISDPMPFLRNLDRALKRNGWDGTRVEPPLSARQLAIPGAESLDWRAWR